MIPPIAHQRKSLQLAALTRGALNARGAAMDASLRGSLLRHSDPKQPTRGATAPIGDQTSKSYSRGGGFCYPKIIDRPTSRGKLVYPARMFARPENKSWRSGFDPRSFSQAPRVMFFKRQKRAERRMKRDFPAQVVLGGFAKRDCKVVDISESSARIAISGAIELPRKFSIAFASSVRPCQLVWRRRDHGWREVPEVINNPDCASGP